MKHAALIAQLDAAAPRLTARVLDEMYADPFWRARFGERADRHGKQDGRFHIDYVIEALRAGDAAIIENYARWLQPVLTSRGMTTCHLAENFERLAAAIADEGWHDGDAACRLLAAASAALAYPAGPARDVQVAANALAHGDRDVALLAGYVADAIALAQPAVFARHVAWLAAWSNERARLVAQLHALRDAVAAAAPSPEARAVLDAGLAALSDA